MPADLDVTSEGQVRMAFVGETPWHGEGQEVSNENKYSVADFMAAAHLDTPVGLKSLQTVDGEPIPERYTYCERTGKLFGCVGPRYVPLQNKDAFDFFQPWLDTKEVSLHTAGALFGGKKVWVQALIEGGKSEICVGDIIEHYIIISNSHDGTTSVRVGFTPKRVVCSNTLSMAHSSNASKLIRVRHGQNVLVNVKNIRETMDLIRQEFVATTEQFRLLATKDISSDDLIRFVKISLNIENLKPEEISTRTKNVMETIFNRFNREISIAGKTWWNAYNAVNGFLNHDYGRSQDSRFDSLVFGQNAAKDKTMLDLSFILSGLRKE